MYVSHVPALYNDRSGVVNIILQYNTYVIYVVNDSELNDELSMIFD